MLEEILLRHREVIDAAVHALEEHTPIDGFLEDLTTRVTELQLQEPSFWELRVVGHIHETITKELKNSLRKSQGEPNADDTERVNRTIQARLRDQLQRLLQLLDDPTRHQDACATGGGQGHFLELFWEDVERLADDSSGQAPLTEDEGEMEHEQASYEAITFDDLQFDTGSVNSSPSTEEIPMILEALGSASCSDRSDAFQRLCQISALELVHCPSHFHQIVEGLCNLLLDTDLELAENSVRLLYSAINHLEDPNQFLDVYLIMVDWFGSCVSSGRLVLESRELIAGSGGAVKTTNAARLVHLLMCRVPYHWIHFPQEKLALVIGASFMLLILDPSTDTVKSWRFLDLIAAIDPTGKWFAKWVAKVPSRAQLFASMDETGLVADILYGMSRICPLEGSVDPVEQTRIASILSILSTTGSFQRGRELLFIPTKLPAHQHRQRRYTEWHGLQEQFPVEVVPSENDTRYRFCPTDRAPPSERAAEFEDGPPLGEQAHEALALSALAFYLFDSTDNDWFHYCVKGAFQGVLCLFSHEKLMTTLFEIGFQCGQPRESFPTEAERREREDRDPWLPFCRPRKVSEVAKLIVDVAHQRGLTSSRRFMKRSRRVFELLVESTSSLKAYQPSLASALTRSMRVYLELSIEDTAICGVDEAVANECRMFSHLKNILVKSPSTMGTALSEESNLIVARLIQLSEATSSERCRDEVVGVLVAFAAPSSMLPALLDAGLCVEHRTRFLDLCMITRHSNLEMLNLLVNPAMAVSFFQCCQTQATLRDLEQACELELDLTIGLNSSPAEGPYRLRMLLGRVARIRAALSTQGAISVLADQSAGLVPFLLRCVHRHKEGTCQANPQIEDLCTFAFDLMTAAAGCIPSMIQLYGLFSQCDALTHNSDDGVSACTFLATSVFSALHHVGGEPTHWIRPRPLSSYSDSSLHSCQPAAERQIGDSIKTFSFSLTTTSTLDQMMSSILKSKESGEALDMLMLSQATWKVIADIENSEQNPQSHRAVTDAFGKLMFQLVQSGQSKLGEGQDGIIFSGPSNPFPSDAERKLMNTYYKDYCARFGLKASPTTLHVLTKTLGTAATDCFAITALMILDQTFSQQQIFEFLQYCASCPCIYALWPRVKNVEGNLPVLLPLAQAAEMILEVEFPQIFTTLCQCNCSVLALILRWHSQCYWNYLTWDSIVLLTYLSFLYGAEFQVYFFVAIVKHFEPTIRAIITNNRGDPARAFVETLQTPIEGFRFDTSRDFFLRLQTTYHDRVQEILLG